MDELQAGVEQSPELLPQRPVLVQPRKPELDDPALWHDREGVQFAAHGDLNRYMLIKDVLENLFSLSGLLIARRV